LLVDLSARPASEEELRSAELLFGDLDLPADALARIAELAGRPEVEFVRDLGWAALIDLDGSTVIAASDGVRWNFLCPSDQDEADAMMAARTLHGRIAKQTEDWDLDR
jgi:hypothetical protein